jgi:hypothetical protein
MLGRSTGVKERAESGRELALKLAHDRKFRKQLLSAISHSAAAKRRARQRGVVGRAKRLAADARLRQEIRSAATSLEKAWTRVEKKRSHKLRNTLIVAGAGAAIAAAWWARAKSPESASASSEPVGASMN